MTTKYLAGAYPGGYTLSTAYNGCVIEASASIGGIGLLTYNTALVTNFGTVDAYSGSAVTLHAGTLINYGSMSSSTTGVLLEYGGPVTNGSASDTSATIIGTRQGVFGGSSQKSATVIRNFGTICGGYALQLFSSVGNVVVNGSQSDRTALMKGYGVAAIYAKYHANVTNYGTIDGSVVGASTVVNSGLITGKVDLNGRSLAVAETGATFDGEIAGYGGTLELASSVGTISGLGSYGTLSGEVTGSFIDFGRYSVDAESSWTLAGTNTVTSGKSLTDDGVVTNTGVLTVDWTVSGAGNLVLAGGSAAMDKGAAIGTASWSLTGGAATINEFLDYSGNFSESSGATLTIASGAHLYLLGPSMLSGTINGTQTVSVADATVSDLILGGKVHLRVTKNALQTGEVTVGDSGTTGAQLIIDKGTAYTMQGPVSIAQGASTKSQLVINGNLIRSGAAGLSVVAVATTVDGTVKVETGTLDFSNQLTGTGSLLIHSGATLQADRSAASSLTVLFGKGRDALALTKPSAFAATLSGFGTGDVIDLLGLHATGASVNDGDQLVIVNGSKTVATLQLSGNYAGATFQAASDGNGGSDITLVSGAIAETGTAAGSPSVPGLITAMASLGAREAITMSPVAHGEMFKPVLLASKA